MGGGEWGWAAWENIWLLQSGIRTTGFPLVVEKGSALWNEWVKTDGKMYWLFSFITAVAVLARSKWFMFVMTSLKLMWHTLTHWWQSNHENFYFNVFFDDITTYNKNFSFSSSSWWAELGNEYTLYTTDRQVFWHYSRQAKTVSTSGQP